MKNVIVHLVVAAIGAAAASGAEAKGAKKMPNSDTSCIISDHYIDPATGNCVKNG
jgi:hypothetical protein